MLGVIIIIYENNHFKWEKYLGWEIFSTYFRSKKHLGVKTISMRVKIIYLVRIYWSKMSILDIRSLTGLNMVKAFPRCMQTCVNLEPSLSLPKRSSFHFKAKGHDYFESWTPCSLFWNSRSTTELSNTLNLEASEDILIHRHPFALLWLAKE